jgi:hypothetical protein
MVNYLKNLNDKFNYLINNLNILTRVLMLAGLDVMENNVIYISYSKSLSICEMINFNYLSNILTFLMNT